MEVSSLKNEYTVIAVIRTFYNKKRDTRPAYKKKIVEAVEKLIEIQSIKYVVVVINADLKNKGERNDGAFTKNLLNSKFGNNLGKRLIIHTISNWGRNAGSAAALNDAASEIFYRLKHLPTRKDIIFNVSVESKIDITHVKKGLALFKKYKDLAVVGIKRKIGPEFQNKLQYKVPQNTASFWRADLLRLAGGFRTECDFAGKTKIKIENRNRKVEIAGMEDFNTLLYLARTGYKWRMMEKENAFKWYFTPNKQNKIKMYRQEKVMKIWSKKFHNLSLSQAKKILDLK